MNDDRTPPGWQDVAADHDVLLDEQAAAHAGRSTRFEEVFAAATRFAEPLAQALEVCRAVPVNPMRIDDSGPLATFEGYGVTLGVTPWDLVRTLLGDRAVAEARARAHLAAGGDVFAAFQGRWRGAWYSQSAAGVSDPPAIYDHDWGATEPLGELLVQPVVMGPWAGAPEGVPAAVHTPGQGIHSARPEAALNAVHPGTGRITGGVGVRRGRTERPHVGYFVDAKTLLWVAREGEPERIGGETTALYSCFFERCAVGGRYLIMGLQFVWRSGADRPGRLDVTLLMGGVYQRPLSV